MSKAMWLCLGLTITAPALADMLNMQPGLWEMKAVKTVIDGTDNTAQISDAGAKMQAAMANMSADQRAKMEAMMQQHGMAINPAGGGTIQMCMTADMVKHNALPVGKDGKCQPTWSQGINSTSFSYSCQNSGVTSSGKGSVTRSGDLLNVVSDGTTTSAAGTHTTHTEVQMRYLGADCGALKPTGGTN